LTSLDSRAGLNWTCPDATRREQVGIETDVLDGAIDEQRLSWTTARKLAALGLPSDYPMDYALAIFVYSRARGSNH